MKKSYGACLIVLLLGIFLTASTGFGEEPLRVEVAERTSPEAREALAAAIPRRELELALRQREEVLAEVKQRMQEMGVRASAEELTDLLKRAAHLEIDRDKCSLGLLKAADCRQMKTGLDAVERRFHRLTGLSPREFRGGRRRETPAPAPAAVPGLLSKAQTCTCALSVYSGFRWMNRWWGLECNNHASHGVCSNNVDSAHSPGTGAMVGDIDLYFGSYHQNLDCPDDHVTCFHGPSTEHPGEWGNACSCDTWHSQSTNPFGNWYGGDLTDSRWVHQLSTPYVTVAGSCNGAYVTVSEFLEENDPWCCDDPMGTLWISVPVADGSGNSPGQASAQNCNGGSQSGVPPYCGTFGATIWVAYICQTSGTPCDPAAEQACWDSGGSWDPSSCYCQMPCFHDGTCAEWDDINCVCLRT